MQRTTSKPSVERGQKKVIKPLCEGGGHERRYATSKRATE